MRAQVVLLKGDRILLAEHRRADGSYWVLPGGAVEPRETPEQAALREVREETGLLIRLERHLFTDGPREDGDIVIKRPRHTYLGSIVGGRLQEYAEPEDGNPGNGYLARIAWMPFDLPIYDGRTRDTLTLVKNALARDGVR